MKRAIFFAFITLCSSAVFAASSEVTIIDLKTCFRDPPFDASRINFVHRFGGNGFKWYVATYTHYFQIQKTQKIIVVPEFGQVYETEALKTVNDSESFESVASYHETATANNFEVQRERLAKVVTDKLKGREIYKCD
jgi:hypothetical protein